MEGDSLRSILERRQKNFNPLPPHGGRLVFFNVFRWILHFNPLPPHGGRPRKRCFKSSSSFISIHSLRMEGDPTFLYPVTTGILFQSTPSAWRETKVHGVISPDCLHFNPLPPHGGRLCRDCHAALHGGISIHSLRMEGDQPHPAPTFRPDISIHSLRMEGDVF